MVRTPRVMPGASLVAFDLRELDGTDLGAGPLETRKGVLLALIVPMERRHDLPGLTFSEALEGATVFAHACKPPILTPVPRL